MVRSCKLEIQLANRVKRIKPSPTLAVTQRAAELKAAGLMHQSGLDKIRAARKDGSWTALDDVEKGIVPPDLRMAFESSPKARQNFENFTKGQRKSYLYWLNQAKRESTRQDRIAEIIRLCEANIKSRA